LKSLREWDAAKKSRKIPSDIPTAPWRTYKNQGWEGFGDWLGTGTIAPFNLEYLPFKEAKVIYQNLAKKYGIKNTTDWRKFLKNHKLPDGIAARPSVVYSQENVFRRMKKIERKKIR